MEFTHDLNTKLPDVKVKDLRKSHPFHDDPRKFEEIGSPKGKGGIKDNYLNNGFYEEGLADDGFLQTLKKPIIRHEDIWVEKVLERERKAKREETKLAHERLKIIEKKTHYVDRDYLSPTTRAKMPEPVILPRSASKNEIIQVEDRAETIEKVEKLQTKRLTPRSLSRKDLAPLNARISPRSPLHRQTISPFKKLS
jgi:hypothetical protein